MAFTVTINGNTYTDASFDGYSYANETTGFPAALKDFMYHARDVLKSSSSTTINLSSLILTNTLSITVEINKFFEVDQAILVYSSSTPADYVFGTVTAYTPNTGVLELIIKEVVGTDTYSNWVAVLGLGKVTAAAASSASAAAASETAAGNSETAAAASELAAGNSETAAGNSETAAGNSETAAAANKGYAEEWAVQPEDIPVTILAGGDGSTTFSAKHWAAKANAVASGNVFDDNIESAILGWTSQRIATEIETKRTDYATLVKLGAVSW